MKMVPRVPSTCHGSRKTIGYQRGHHAENLEETLRNPEKLWPAKLQTNAASTGITRKDRVQELPCVSSGRYPVIELLFGSVLPFDADTRTVRST